MRQDDAGAGDRQVERLRVLRKLRDAAGRRFAAGMVLYDGEASVGFGEGLFAVPIRALWELA